MKEACKETWNRGRKSKEKIQKHRKGMREKKKGEKRGFKRMKIRESEGEGRKDGRKFMTRGKCDW